MLFKYVWDKYFVMLAGKKPVHILPTTEPPEKKYVDGIVAIENKYFV